MDTRIQIIAIVLALVLLLSVLELVRRRRLMERYALLWIGSAVVLLLLAVWRNLLENIASALGIFYAPSALFFIAFGFFLLLVLHFSTTISRLTDQSKILAQRIAELEQKIRDREVDG